MKRLIALLTLITTPALADPSASFLQWQLQDRMQFLQQQQLQEQQILKQDMWHWEEQQRLDHLDDDYHQDRLQDEIEGGDDE